MIEEQSNC